MGQVLIPVPVLGAIIGNAAGMYMYGIAKDYLDKKEKKIIAEYVSSIEALNAELNESSNEYIEMMNRKFAKFESVVELAFDLDVNVSFAKSITLARSIGVSEEKVLLDKNAIDAYFIN